MSEIIEASRSIPDKYALVCIRNSFVDRLIEPAVLLKCKTGGGLPPVSHSVSVLISEDIQREADVTST